MKLQGLDQSKHSINLICKKRKASPTTQRLLENFHENLKSEMGFYVPSKVHDRGITYFCSEQKAFIFLNINQNFLTLIFFTGKGEIQGLAKGTWLHAGETCGSERFRIVDEITLDRAISFAKDSYELAKEWIKKV